MKAIQCELCGNNQLIKKDGYFQCEYCGTKYTLEEAKKLIVSGAVQIEGDVKTKDADFIIKAGTLIKYNGEATEVTIPDGVKRIGTDAFKGLDIEKIIIPNGVISIDGSAFRSCRYLTSVTIPDSVTSIRERAFSVCTSLTSITIPNSVTSIGYDAFSSCTSLTSVTIPDSVTSIRYNAFSSCTSLTSITISDSVTSIEHGAFSGCTALDPAKIQVPISKNEIFDSSFLEKGYCVFCAGQLKHSFLFKEKQFGKKCTRCGRQYDSNGRVYNK